MAALRGLRNFAGYDQSEGCKTGSGGDTLRWYRRGRGHRPVLSRLRFAMQTGPSFALHFHDEGKIVDLISRVEVPGRGYRAVGHPLDMGAGPYPRRTPGGSPMVEAAIVTPTAFPRDFRIW